MKIGRLSIWELVGVVASILLLISLFGFEWYSLTDTVERRRQSAWLCGVGEFSCTGWQTLTLGRYLLLGVAFSAPILALLVLFGSDLEWAEGEVTAILGITAIVLIGYNGIIAKPGAENFGVGVSYGYWIALLSAVAIFAAGGWRYIESGGGPGKKPPGTF